MNTSDILDRGVPGLWSLVVMNTSDILAGDVAGLGSQVVMNTSDILAPLSLSVILALSVV